MSDPEDDSTATPDQGERSTGADQPGGRRSDSQTGARRETTETARSRPTAGGSRDPPPTRTTGPRTERPSDTVLFIRDVVTSVGAVVLIGLYIFTISGVWPPMVAIESGSMEPNMSKNDLIFVMETDRFHPDAAHDDTGVVTAQAGEAVDYEQFGGPGDVIIYNPRGNTQVTPIIHRAMFWVEEGENWCDRANDEYISGTEQCSEAPHAGFITKGDNNPTYDQSGSGNLTPVKPEWVVGTSEVQIPGLGWLRLQF
ncbi:S26 family signal peptidase [Halovenus halobia]|uniref:S26 family signal peptidase n=1 Tax=Halovenus halobia TaxID=3396622 RepID=UPI003F570784